VYRTAFANLIGMGFSITHVGRNSGVVVVEKRGRVVIPAVIRRALGIREGMKLEVSVEEGKVVLKPIRKISARDLFGIAGTECVDLEEIESALSEEP